MSKRILAILLAAILATPVYAQQNNVIDFNSLPVPSTGSTYTTNSATVSGDWIPINRNGVTYKTLFGLGGTCASGTYVNYINPQGVPTCGTPAATTFTLGTSTILTNPQKSGDITTGLYSAAPHTVGISAGGVAEVVASQSGTAIGSFLSVNNNASALPAAQTGSVLQAVNATGTANRIEIDGVAASGYTSTVRYDGTLASKTTLQAGDEIGGFNAWGYNGTAVVGPRAAFRTWANQNWTTGAQGTYADVAVTANGATSEAPTVRFENNGGVTIGTSYVGTNVAPANGLIASGSVGIGTATINNKLDVYGSAAFGTYGGTAAPANGMIVSGNVGIGTTSPANALDVNGSLAVGTYAGIVAGTSNELIVSGSVGIGSTSPRAVLDISQNTGAMILPIGTTGQEPSPAYNGMIRYNSTKPAIEVYSNSAWSTLNAQIVSWGNGGQEAASGSTGYNGIGFYSTNSNVDRWAPPVAGTLSNLTCNLSTGPTSTNTVTCTMFCNNSAVNETCQITSTATQCQDTTHTDIISAQENCIVRFIYSGSATTSFTDATAIFTRP